MIRSVIAGTGCGCGQRIGGQYVMRGANNYTEGPIGGFSLKKLAKNIK